MALCNPTTLIESSPVIPKQIYLMNLGCTRRQLDTQRLALYFEANRWQITQQPEAADLIILMSCAYAQWKADESISWVKRFWEMPGRLMVAGCLPAIEPERLANVFTGLVLHPHNMIAVNTYFPDHSIRYEDIPDPNHMWMDTRTDSIFFMRIGQGCAGACSFCAIRKATGRHKSKPLDLCIREIRTGIAQGYTHMQLLSDDVGAYGLDIGSTFPTLLAKVLALDSTLSVKFEDFNPMWVVRYQDEMECLAATGRIYHILAPIQSGNRRILRKMRRYSEVDQIRIALGKIKSTHEHLRLVTNCMVGFPTETDEEFVDTLAMIIDIGFNDGRIYPFSAREGTPAALMDGQVHPEIMHLRLSNAARIFKDHEYHVSWEDSVLYFSLTDQFE